MEWGQLGVVGENLNVTSLCFLTFKGNHYKLDSEYINQTYILCNLTSNLELEPIEEKSDLQLSISNNQGL